MGDALRDAMEMPRGTEMDEARGLGQLFAELTIRLRHARANHDWPTIDTEAKAKFYALDAMQSEWEELEQAIVRKEGRAREMDEALDVMAVAARFWLGDHLPEGGK